MKPIYSVLIVITFFASISTYEKSLLKDSEAFNGLRPEVASLKSEDGSRYFELHELNVSPITNLNIVRDSEPIQKSWVTLIKEKVFGKDEETILWESFYDEKVHQFEKKQKYGRNHLQAENDEYDLTTDEFEISYGMTLYVGTPPQQVEDVVFDTGSHWLVLQSSECSTCYGPTFNGTASSSIIDDYSDEMDLLYGSAYVEGKDIYDDVYLDEEHTFGVDYYNLMLAEYQTGLSPLGGIFGFCRYYGIRALYHHQLVTDGYITDPIFSLYLADYPDQSFFQMGGYNSDHYEGDITWFDIGDTFFWELSVSGVRIKEKKEFIFEQEFNLIVDSGSTLSYIDTKVASKIFKKMLSWTGFYFKFQGVYFINCKVKKFKPVDFLINNHWVSISPEVYVRDIGSKTICQLAIMEIDMEDYWLFGGTLLRNYYSIWDDDNGRLGLALRKDGYEVEPIYEISEDERPTKVLKSKKEK